MVPRIGEPPVSFLSGRGYVLTYKQNKDCRGVVLGKLESSSDPFYRDVLEGVKGKTGYRNCGAWGIMEKRNKMGKSKEDIPYTTRCKKKICVCCEEIEKRRRFSAFKKIYEPLMCDDALTMTIKYSLLRGNEDGLLLSGLDDFKEMFTKFLRKFIYQTGSYGIHRLHIKRNYDATGWDLHRHLYFVPKVNSSQWEKDLREYWKDLSKRKDRHVFFLDRVEYNSLPTWHREVRMEHFIDYLSASQLRGMYGSTRTKVQKESKNFILQGLVKLLDDPVGFKQYMHACHVNGVESKAVKRQYYGRYIEVYSITLRRVYRSAKMALHLNARCYASWYENKAIRQRYCLAFTGA